MKGHDNSQDLPLFAWQPSRRLIPFPLDRRQGLVREVARRLLRLTGDNAMSYWCSVLAERRAELAGIGLDENEQDGQLQALFDAVNSQMANSIARGRDDRGETA